jgi:hypothetical protein
MERRERRAARVEEVIEVDVPLGRERLHEVVLAAGRGRAELITVKDRAAGRVEPLDGQRVRPGGDPGDGRAGALAAESLSDAAAIHEDLDPGDFRDAARLGQESVGVLERHPVDGDRALVAGVAGDDAARPEDGGGKQEGEASHWELLQVGLVAFRGRAPRKRATDVPRLAGRRSQPDYAPRPAGRVTRRHDRVGAAQGYPGKCVGCRRLEQMCDMSERGQWGAARFRGRERPSPCVFFESRDSAAEWGG